MLRNKPAAALPDLALDALGNPERRKLVLALSQSPRSVGELAAEFPISRPAVSRHLAQLERARLVAHRSEGTRNVYFLDKAGLEATSDGLNRFWDEAEARLRLVAENTRPRSKPRE